TAQKTRPERVEGQNFRGEAQSSRLFSHRGLQLGTESNNHGVSLRIRCTGRCYQHNAHASSCAISLRGSRNLLCLPGVRRNLGPPFVAAFASPRVNAFGSKHDDIPETVAPRAGCSLLSSRVVVLAVVARDVPLSPLDQPDKVALTTLR